VVEDGLVLFSKNFQILLKGGTLEKIIERLMMESNPDAYNDIVDTFLLTYRGFTSANDLLEKLFSYYDLKPPKPTYSMNEQETQEYETKKKVVRLRLGTVIKRWLNQHFHDFGSDVHFYNRLVEIVTATFSKNEKGLGETILATLVQESEKFGNRAKKELQFSEISPPPILPTSPDFEDFDPIEVARQLCLFDQELLRDIEPKECLNQAWNKDKENATHIGVMIEFFNNFSSFVATKICSAPKSRDRARILQKFLQILAVLYENNNFNSSQSILAGLNSSAVFRLSITWGMARKDKHLGEIFDQVTQILNSGGSYSLLRKTIKTVNPPCIPYIGMYLTDLTFIEDGNPRLLVVEPPREDIINFEKMRKVAVVIQEIILFQQKPYNFEKVEVIQQFFQKIVKKRRMSRRNDQFRPF